MFDLAIIGGGPAGYTAAERASKSGLSVVLFEKKQLGGVCLNEGCIPTKTMLYSAKLYNNAKNSAKYGIVADNVTFDYEKIVARKNKIVRKLNAGIRAKMTAHNVKIINAEASVQSAENTIQISCNNELFEAKKLLLCTGSETVIPPIKGIDTTSFWTSKEALEAKIVPKSLVIVGGGVIGLEFAGLFNTFGSAVTVIEMAPEILPGIDSELAIILHTEYTKQGVNFHTGAQVLELKENEVIFSTTDGEQSIQTEIILLCVGRQPNLKNLGLEPLDLEHFRKGLAVNEKMQTSHPKIYAAGDITGFSMLAHTASREAEVAVNHIVGIKDKMNYAAVPAVVYTNPEIAGVGPTEESLQAKGIKYSVSKLPMTFSGRFVAENDGGTGLCKLLFDEQKQLLGAHIIGNPASELITIAALAIETHLTVEQFKKLVFPHPSVGEIFKETLFEDF